MTHPFTPPPLHCLLFPHALHIDQIRSNQVRDSPAAPAFAAAGWPRVGRCPLPPACTTCPDRRKERNKEGGGWEKEGFSAGRSVPHREQVGSRAAPFRGQLQVGKAGCMELSNQDKMDVPAPSHSLGMTCNMSPSCTHVLMTSSSFGLYVLVNSCTFAHALIYTFLCSCTSAFVQLLSYSHTPMLLNSLIMMVSPPNTTCELTPCPLAAAFSARQTFSLPLALHAHAMAPPPFHTSRAVLARQSTTNLPTYLRASLPACLPTYLPTYLPTHPPTHPPSF